MVKFGSGKSGTKDPSHRESKDPSHREIAEEIAFQKANIKLFLWRLLNAGIRLVGFFGYWALHHVVDWVLKGTFTDGFNPKLLALASGAINIVFLIIYVDMGYEMLVIFIPSLRGRKHEQSTKKDDKDRNA